MAFTFHNGRLCVTGGGLRKPVRAGNNKAFLTTHPTLSTVYCDAYGNDNAPSL